MMMFCKGHTQKCPGKDPKWKPFCMFSVKKKQNINNNARISCRHFPKMKTQTHQHPHAIGAKYKTFWKAVVYVYPFQQKVLRYPNKPSKQSTIHGQTSSWALQTCPITGSAVWEYGLLL